MKKIFIALIVIVAIFAWSSSNKKEPEITISTPNPTANDNQSVTIDVDGVPMRVNWIEVDPEKLELYSNLSAKQTSAAIKVEKKCDVLVNGGFYSKENKHLGLLIRSPQTISPAIESSLFNGFLTIDSQAVITTSAPITARLAVQSGPIIVYKNEPRKLSIKNDEQARRVVAATTSDGKLLFLAIHRKSSEFQGPYLEELPKIIQSFNNSSNIKIVDAINLDGGSASTFNTDSLNLPERTQIGSYFCEVK
ncbi:phosphodiester glycosidase family protein [Candidatus Microgenomates bacterium]|nr:phosphodiester glycosidase family protein [Candidatus Microgenomates bacterium]